MTKCPLLDGECPRCSAEDAPMESQLVRLIEEVLEDAKVNPRSSLPTRSQSRIYHLGCDLRDLKGIISAVTQMAGIKCCGQCGRVATVVDAKNQDHWCDGHKQYSSADTQDMEYASVWRSLMAAVGSK